MEYHVYWLLKSSCFELFGDGKCGHFWAKKLMERWYLLITGKFLFWTLWRWEIRYFFELKSWWKDDIYWLLKDSCFELLKGSCFGLSGDGKHSIFLSQKVDEKIIFTWHFWAFDDIPGLGKYGFSWSESNAGEVIVSNSGKCNFREAFIVPTIGLFHGICFCTQWTVSLSLSFIRSTYAIRIKSMCSKNEITKVDMYMQIELQKMVSNISILSLKRFGYFFSSHWRNCF